MALLAINGDVAENAMHILMHNPSLQTAVPYEDILLMATISKYVWDGCSSVQRNLALYDVAKAAAISLQMRHIGEVMSEHVDMLHELPLLTKDASHMKHMQDCALYLVYEQCKQEDREVIRRLLLEEGIESLSPEQQLAKGAQLWNLLAGEGLPQTTRDIMHRSFRGVMSVAKLGVLLPVCRRAWQRYTENRQEASGLEWETIMRHISILIEPLVCRLLPVFNGWSLEASALHRRSGSVMRKLADWCGLVVDEYFLMETDDDYCALVEEAIIVGRLDGDQIEALLAITGTMYQTPQLV